MIKNQIAENQRRAALLNEQLGSLKAEYDIAIAKSIRLQGQQEVHARLTVIELTGLSTKLVASDMSNFEGVLKGNFLSEIDRASAAMATVTNATRNPSLEEAEAASVMEVLAEKRARSEALLFALEALNGLAHGAKGKLSQIETNLATLKANRAAHDTLLSNIRAQNTVDATDVARLAALSTSVPLVGDVFFATGQFSDDFPDVDCDNCGGGAWHHGGVFAALLFAHG